MEAPASPAPPERTPPEAGSLRDDQRRRRQRIVDTAARLMVQEDYDRIQVKDVAREAGVALGTLYRYFNSKEHLFACALRSWAEGFGDRLDTSAGGTAVERVKATYRRAARAFERQPRVYNVMMQVQSSRDPHARAGFRDFAARQTLAFQQALAPSRLPESRRKDVIAVMSAVLDENLRSWQLGLQPFEEVYRAVDAAAELILGGG